MMELHRPEYIGYEPFARHFMSAGNSSADVPVNVKIAYGMYGVALESDVELDDDTQLMQIKSPHMAVNYSYGGGIGFDGDSLRAKAEKYPDKADLISTIINEFAPRNTGALIWNSFSQNELDLNQSGACWGGTWGGHANPNYDALLHLGIDGIKKEIIKYRAVNPDKAEFYDGVDKALDSVLVLGEKCLEYLKEKLSSCTGDEKEKYEKLVRAYEVIPRFPAYDFLSAAQFFWLVYSFDGIDSPGRFDQFMIDYYRKSDKSEANFWLENLWKAFYKTRSWNLCIGGTDENWNDVSNELSYAVLETAAKFKYHTPNLTMRVSRSTPDSLWKKAADVIATGIGMPALYNDEAVCPALESLGIPPVDAHLYCMNGCNQIDIMGKSHMGLEDGEVSLYKCLDLALNDGVCSITGKQIGIKTGDASEFSTFDELMDAYKKQVEFVTLAAISCANKAQKIYSEHAPNPRRSALIDGCLIKGRDYKSGGPLYGHGQILTEGIADTADSLAAVKRFVFEEKSVTMVELIHALKTNFADSEDLRIKLANSDKFGNDNEYTDVIAGEIIDHFFRFLMTQKTFRGGYYSGGCSPFTRAPDYGRAVGAMPNGRKKSDSIIADSIGATPGRNTNGPTAALKSALNYNHKLAGSGFILNLKFGKNMLASAKGRDSFISLAKAYFANYGQQLSVTVVSADELKDAQLHPENHRNLIVRVGGFSDYFANLSKDLQDNVIKRTEFEL